MIVRAEHLHGILDAVPSKSALHRRWILNHIAGASDAPQGFCDDVRVTAECLQKLGTKDVLDCGECGAALRFLLPVSLLYGGASFSGSDSLKARPIEPLLNVLKEHGAQVDGAQLPLSVRGALRPGDYRLGGGISSQFFSGLLLTLPFLSGDSTLTWTTPIGSLGYLRMTEAMLKEHGVSVERTEHGYRIPGNQRPKRLPLSVEGDWSCAAPMLLLGAIAGSVTVRRLSPTSLQPDRKVLDILRQCGALVRVQGDEITVMKGRLMQFKCGGADAPDLIPAAAALACACEGDSVLYKLERLRYKESDRFAAILKLLRSVGADFEPESDSTIVIHGSGSIAGGTADVPGDHRMVMAAAVLSACSAAPIRIPHADSVTKSYPHFWDDFQRIGGHIDAI